VRKELLETSVTVYPTDSREVPVDQILRYAKFIGRTTVPPEYREPDDKEGTTTPTTAAATATAMAAQSQSQSQSQSQTVEHAAEGVGADVKMSNGAGTSPASQLPQTQLTDGPTDTQATTVDTTATTARLTHTVSEWSKQPADPWAPWPDDFKIQSGVLRHVQWMAENGQDPATVLSKEEQEARDRQKADAEEKMRKKEAQEREAEERKVREVIARRRAEAGAGEGSGTVGQPGREEGEDDSFFLYDPDEEG
jgi:hypothetical protein